MFRINWQPEGTIFPQAKPNLIFAFDTETTGLNIGTDTIFMASFAVYDPETNKGYAIAVDDSEKHFRSIVEYYLEYMEQCEIAAAHNTKFDLHMLMNTGFNPPKRRYTDTEFYIRFAHDAVQTDKGGAPQKLKQYATRYIDKSAADDEKYITKLKRDFVNQYPKLPKKISEKLKDSIATLEDLTPEERSVYMEWLTSLPLRLQKPGIPGLSADMIPYDLLPREPMRKYATLDAKLVLEIIVALTPYIEHRHQTEFLRLEEDLIYPFLEMERTGFEIDQELLKKYKADMITFIKTKRARLAEILDSPIGVNQHQKIRALLNEKYDMQLMSVGEDKLKQVADKLQDEHPAKEAIDLICTLRTAEKWFSTYIKRFEDKAKVYTGIKQTGPVSGRIASDMQQMPKDAFAGTSCEPRRLILCPENSTMIFFDYSQVELRVQALYTLVIGYPDINMLRAYMPYQLEGEEAENWIPTDVHGKTTEFATGLKPDHQDFKRLRTTIGKKVNFAKNYGAGFAKIRQSFPQYSEEECRRIDASYYLAFPGVKKYHEYCETRAREHAYTSNLFGYRYYNVPGHNLKNYLVQGTAAIMLKKKILEVYDYINDNDVSAQLMMQVHDEIILLWQNPVDYTHVQRIKDILEDWPQIQVPIIADVETSTTNWAEKGEWDGQIHPGNRPVGSVQPRQGNDGLVRNRFK